MGRYFWYVIDMERSNIDTLVPGKSIFCKRLVDGVSNH